MFGKKKDQKQEDTARAHNEGKPPVATLKQA
jgi:hypothetical protein